MLVQFMLNRFKMKLGKRIDGIGRATMQRLLDYHWPGNIRELENLLERAVILATGPVLEIDPSALASETTSTGAQAAPLDLDAIQRAHILSILQRTDWVIDGDNGAAKLLGLHPNTLRSRLKKMGITRPDSNAVASF